MIHPYSTEEIRERADYFGKALEMYINQFSYAEIGRELGADPRIVEFEVERLKYTLSTTDEHYNIFWNILAMPGRWNWRPTEKGLALIGEKE